MSMVVSVQVLVWLAGLYLYVERLLAKSTSAPAGSDPPGRTGAARVRPQPPPPSALCPRGRCYFREANPAHQANKPRIRANGVIAGIDGEEDQGTVRV